LIAEGRLIRMTDESHTGSQIATQGYSHFFTEKKKMLDNFDHAKKQGESHEVETYHGLVAEAQFRNWLSTFLPKKFGVTSGYIVSQRVSEEQKIPHFDVIIYDQLNAPIIGVEESPDVSPAGRALILPVEYVLAVIEVKASFTTYNATKAVEHLCDLRPFLEKVDPHTELYKKHLPPQFSSCIVFFEMGKNPPKGQDTLFSKMVPVDPLRGYYGGIVLRIKESQPEKSMRMEMLSIDGKENLVPDIGYIQFQRFTFDLLSRLNGYPKGGIRSYHGFPVYMFSEPKPEPVSPTKEEGKKVPSTEESSKTE
jgi:hypothetical protein